MQLDRKRDEFEKRGIHIAALSFDSPAILQNFAERTGVKMTLLSDPESTVIKTFGILNESLPKTHQFYGIPNPGEYLIGPDGVVKAKFFEQAYVDRYTAGQILVRTLGADGGGARTEIQADHLKLTAWASDDVVRGGNRFSLAIDVELPEKMHLYAPQVKGYIPIEWKMDEAEGVTNFPADYPQPETLHLPAINETVPVYQGSFRVIRDVMLGRSDAIKPLLNAQGELVIKGSLRYQACDDKICYLPQTVPIEWKIGLEPDDRTRVPEELQRKAPQGQ